MKVTKTYSLGIMLFFIVLSSTAQDIKSVKIGDQLPDFSIQLFNEKKSITKRDLLTTPLLIINFWATWCVPCLKEIELLDSLSAKYPDKFQVLMVTSQDSLLIADFFKKNPHYNVKQLKFLTNDTFFNLSFPHRGIPHNIWVNANGEIKAITNAEDLNIQNILDFENSSKKILPEKIDNLTFDIRKQFDLLNDKFTYRSIIGPRVYGVSGQSMTPNVLANTAKQFTYINGSITQLAYAAYKFGGFREEFIALITKDSLRFIAPYGKRSYLLKGSSYQDLKDWSTKNTYSMQFTLQDHVPVAKFRRYLYDELERNFKVKINEEMSKRTVTLAKIRRKNKVLSPQTLAVPKISNLSNYVLKVHNATPQQVFDWYTSVLTNSKVAPYPYVIKGLDGLVLDTSIDFGLVMKKYNITELNEYVFQKTFEQFGFTFTKKQMKYKILKIEDLN